MILYGSSFSPFVRKTMAYAAEKELELPVQNIGLGSADPEFQRASPFGKMPAFIDGDFAISDSSAIITYLEAKYPQPAMLPADPADRARVIWFEEFADTIMMVGGGKVFFNRVVMPVFMKQDGDEAAARDGETNDLPQVLAYLETVVPDPGGFLVGSTISLADIAVASPFVNYELGRAAIDHSHYPRTYAWVASIHARQSFVPIIKMEKKVLGWT
jgi:glutathione S-transferase